MSTGEDSESILERVRTALAAHDFTILAPVLASDVQFASCLGRQQVIDFLSRKFGEGLQLELVEIDSEVDRLIATIDLQVTKRDDPSFGTHRHFAILFLRDQRIVELQMAASREAAFGATPSPLPPPRPDSPTVISSLAPVLPVRDLAAALEHYGRLGFRVRAYEGGGYGYADRDGLSLHLIAYANLDPALTTSAIYLYVGNADLLYAEWRSAGVSGQFFEPHDTAYGLREGAHIDRDGNLLRFGSRIDPRVNR